MIPLTVYFITVFIAGVHSYFYNQDPRLSVLFGLFGLWYLALFYNSKEVAGVAFLTYFISFVV